MKKLIRNYYWATEF